MTLFGTAQDKPNGWKPLRVLYSGPSAYSAIAVPRDGLSVLVMYERGVKGPCEQLHLTSIDVAEIRG